MEFVSLMIDSPHPDPPHQQPPLPVAPKTKPMNYSRRVAAWLYALPVVLVAALYGRLSKLEMISFWLLCWKLLRATSGVKRIKESEQTESCADSDSPQHAPHIQHTPHSPHTQHTPHTQHVHREQQQQHNLLSHSVAMETSSTASLIGCWVEREDYGKGNENYPAGRGAEDEEPGDGPLVQEEGKDEQEAYVETGGHSNLTELLSSSSLFGGKEEGEDEEERGEEAPYKVEDLFSEDIDENSSAPSDIAGEMETQAVPNQQIKKEALSTMGSGHEPEFEHDPDDLSDCLQVEMALVSSDSDSDDQCRAFHADQDEEEKLGDLQDDPEQLKQPETCSAPLTSSPQESSLTLIPEDGEGSLAGSSARRTPVLRSPSVCSDPETRRVPQDYCVLQENRSENVNPEHLDFLGAQQQWRQMEKDVKGQVAVEGGQLLPQLSGGIRAGSGFGSQGAHSVLYMPVRNIERTSSQGAEGLHLAMFSPLSEDSGVEELSGRSPYDELENPVEREIRLTMEREESFKRERSQTLARTRPSTLYPHPQGDDRKRVSSSAPRTPTFSISPSLSPSPSPHPVYHEMSASNVIILEPDSSFPTSPQRHRPHGLPLLSPSPAPHRFSDWPPSDTPSVIILETSNLIIRSASEFCLSSAVAGGGGETVQESTFTSNPFFKLRSRSSMSLVEQEIRAVKQREEEWRRQRAQLQVGGTTRERYDTVVVSPNLLERTEMPVRCMSSPSSPSKRKMDHSTLPCDHRFPTLLSSVSSSPCFSATPRRQNAMAQRWEAGLIGRSQD